MMDGCFIAKLQHYLPLTDKEKACLRAIEENPVTYPAGHVLFTENETPAEALYVVQAGRLHSSTLLADGGRALLKLFFPGDMIGNTSIPFTTASNTVQTVTEVRVCLVPKARLSVIFEEQPRIAALLYTISMLEQVALSDRLRSIGRTDGKARIAALIMEVISRMRITDSELENTFDLNMTQAEIGDATGMTHVHVNRLLRELGEDGLIDRKGSEVTILDEDRLLQISSFSNRYKSIAADWLPASR